MENVRIGNSVHVSWRLYNNNGSQYMLSGKIRRLWIMSAALEKEITSYGIQGRNELIFSVPADDLIRYGTYKVRLTIRESESETEDATYELTQVFQVVSQSYPEASGAVGGVVDLSFTSVLNNVVVERIEGLSAYEIAVNNGYEGTEQEWIAMYDNAVAAANNAAEDAIAATEAMTANEESRQSSESARDSAEQARIAAEAARVSAEQSRVSAETARETQASADHTRAESDHSTAQADHTIAASDHTQAVADHAAVQESLINDVEVTVSNTTGTPVATVDFSDNTLSFAFSNIKGDKGDTDVTKQNIETALGYTPASTTALSQAVTGLGTAIDGKVDKVTGKGLSTNDYTTEEKDKLAGLPSGSELADDLAAKEDVSNKVTTVTSSGTDTQYPSAKAVFDAIEGKKDPTVIAESGAEIVYRQTHGGVATGFSGAAVKGLKGRTLAWNQLVQNGNFAEASGWASTNFTVAISGGILTATSTSSSDNSSSIDGNVLGTIQGHKYYIRASVRFDTELPSTTPWIGSGGYDGVTAPVSSFAVGTWGTIGGIFTRGTGGDDIIRFYPRPAGWEVGDTVSIKDFICVDLTLMFGAGNEPSTVAEFEAMFPLPYYGYNEGELINNSAEGIETVGFNIFDEEIMSGWAYITRNADGWSGALNRFWSHRCFENTFNYTGRVFINMNYSLDEGTGFLTAYYVDGTYNDFRLDPATRATVGYETPAGKVIDYIEFSYTRNGTLTIHSLCVNLSDASRNGTYEPHWSKVLPLGLDAFKVKDSQGNIITVNGLASAGDVRDEIRGGKYIKRVGRVDLGTLTWALSVQNGFNRFNAELSLTPANGTSLNFAAQINAKGYENNGKPISDNDKDKSLGYYYYTNNVYIRDDAYPTSEAFKTAMSGVCLYYELATPVEYDLASPMPSLYAVDDCGTEAKYPADTATSVTAPITADIQYGIKSRDIAAEAEDIFTAIRNLQS